MKKLLTLFFCCLFAVAAQAQMNRDLWFKGTVELEGGELISGQLSYYSDFKTALLQIRAGGKTYSYDANQLISFRFFDDQLNVTRTFYSLPYKGESGHQVMLFFEALLEGGYLSALSKTEFRAETRQNNAPYAYRGYYIPTWYDRTYARSYTVVVPYETIYLVTPDTDIRAYSQATSLASQDVRFRKPEPDMLLDLVRDKRVQIEKFMDTNNIDLRRRNDVLQVITYYNQLKDQNP